MRSSTFARKPPEKRGVNKATMDAPQEEFITDDANVPARRKTSRTKAEQIDDDSTAKRSKPTP